MVLWFHQPPLPTAAPPCSCPASSFPVLGATALRLSCDGFQTLLCSSSHGRMEDLHPQQFGPGNPGLGHSGRRSGTVPSVPRTGR